MFSKIKNSFNKFAFSVEADSIIDNMRKPDAYIVYCGSNENYTFINYNSIMVKIKTSEDAYLSECVTYLTEDIMWKDSRPSLKNMIWFYFWCKYQGFTAIFDFSSCDKDYKLCEN